MIILPAISGLIAFLRSLIEPVLIGAGIGALFSGGASLVGDTIRYQEDGISHQEQIDMRENVVQAGAEGAIFGALFGIFTPLIAPAIAPAATMVDDVATNVIASADDVVKPAVSAFDDVAKPVASAADDAANAAKSPVVRSGAALASGADDGACLLLCRLGKSASSFPRRVAAAANRARNYHNANSFMSLPRGSGIQGYFYAMDDVATSGRYKLGITTRPVERLKEVQSKTGLKLKYTCIIGTDDMNSLETSLFEEFNKQRRPDLVQGTTEIFLLNAAQLSSICSR